MTREEALTEIKERVHVAEYVDSSYVDCVDIEALRMAIKALEQPEQRWIPCSERLPEGSNFYIVTHKDFSVGFRWYSVFHGWEWQEKDEPVAWMPLPEPYREEGEHE